MKSVIKRAIAVLLILTVALLTACSVTMDAVKAAEIGDSDVDLSSYGEYISNDELGELVSYGGYISKTEYSAMLATAPKELHTTRALRFAMIPAEMS